MTKLSVHLVTWNGVKYIPYLFDSLKKQNFSDWKLVILDNGSSDDTVKKIKHEIQDFPVDVEFIELKENVGFAGGHNYLYQGERNKEKGTSEYILLLNQDMYLMEGTLEKMVAFLNEHEDVAAVSPRLMKWNFELCETPSQPPSREEKSSVGSLLEERQGGVETSFTNKIDSLGLKVSRNRRVIELNTGENWETYKLTNLQTYKPEVFGVSGALPMYRRSAIENVTFSDGNFFDSLYNSYKEDVDLAYRLRIAGYRAYVLLDTVAYHDRSAEGIAQGDKVAIKNKKTQSAWVRYHSYKNHLMTLYKNEYWQNCFLDGIFIKWYECKKFVWFLLFDRAVLKGLAEVWKARKVLRGKREEVRKMRKISWRELRQWWI